MDGKNSELELRIKEFTVNKPEFVEKLLEEKRCELKVFSVFSDGVLENTYNMQIEVSTQEDHYNRKMSKLMRDIRQN